MALHFSSSVSDCSKHARNPIINDLASFDGTIDQHLNPRTAVIYCILYRTLVRKSTGSGDIIVGMTKFFK